MVIVNSKHPNTESLFNRTISDVVCCLWDWCQNNSNNFSVFGKWARTRTLPCVAQLCVTVNWWRSINICNWHLILNTAITQIFYRWCCVTEKSLELNKLMGDVTAMTTGPRLPRLVSSWMCKLVSSQLIKLAMDRRSHDGVLLFYSVHSTYHRPVSHTSHHVS